MKQTIGQNVDNWVEEESHERTLALKVVRQNDPLARYERRRSRRQKRIHQVLPAEKVRGTIKYLILLV